VDGDEEEDVKQPMARRRSMYAEKATPVKTVEAPPWSEAEPVEKSATGTKNLSPPRKNRASVPDGDKKSLIKPEWVSTLKTIGVTATEFGKLWGVPPSTYKDWARGADPTPAWVSRAVMLMADPEVMKRLRDGGDNAGAAQGAAKLRSVG